MTQFLRTLRHVSFYSKSVRKNLALSLAISDRETQKITKLSKNKKTIADFTEIKPKFVILTFSHPLSKNTEKHINTRNCGLANEHCVSSAISDVEM